MVTKTISTEWTTESVIDLIRKLRNDLVKDFLDERFLKQYVEHQFRIREMSGVRIELIKKDLKELLISPVDINHYKPLIAQIQETDSAALTEVHEKLFYKEIEALLKRYIY